MGTLPLLLIKGYRLSGMKILPAADDRHHPRFPVLVFVITVMIGMQAPQISCSGGVGLGRPYLFRDFGMLTGYGPQQPHSSSSSPHDHVATLFSHHQQKSVLPAHFSAVESAEDETMGGSSEEGEETQQYTAPLILDIDDPEVKARWMGLSDHEQSFEEDEEEYEDDEPGQRSLSSREFQSRSSQQIRSSGDTTDKESEKTSGTSEEDSSDKRGILDNFNFNPFSSFWQGEESEDDTAQLSGLELPQSDEIPEYSYYPYAYDTNPTDYYYDPGDAVQYDQKPKPMMPQMMPQMVPMQMMPKPKPKQKAKQPKPKPMSKPPKAKAKQPKPKQKPKRKKPKPMKMKPMMPMSPPGGMMMMQPMRVKKREPQYSQQYHYQQQQMSKPDKLSVIADKLSKLNPLNYIQIQRPQIKITKIQDSPPKMGPPPMMPSPSTPPMMMQKPKRPKMKRPKPPKQMKGPKPPKPMKGPKPPKKMKRPKPPPPSMMQTMMNAMKPKPRQPRPKQKMPRPTKPQGEESNPEFVMYLGEPFADAFSPDQGEDEGQEDYRQEDDDEDEADDDDDDNEEDEEDEEDEGDDGEGEDYHQIPQVASVSHTQMSSGEMGHGEAVMASDDDDAVEEAESEAEGTTEPVPVEDDEGDYEDGVIGLVKESSHNDGGDAETRTEETEADQKEKSLSITKLFGWRKRKRRRHPPKPGPARKPPNWKEYRPAPLLPEIPDGISDAILKVVKNVGFLPEYDKTEKYGGHNKIKGKFTKTRPITLHHGLLTEVLRRR